MEEKCKRVLNIIRCVAGQGWGADRLALKTIYITLIRSVMDYGSIYGSAAKTHLDKLERIQAKALRICCGAYPSSPVSVLQVEVGDMPLRLTAVYWANLRGQDKSHATLRVLEQCWEYGKKECNSFGWTVGDLVNELDIKELSITPRVALPAVHLWILPQPLVDLRMLEHRKKRRAE